MPLASLLRLSLHLSPSPRKPLHSGTQSRSTSQMPSLSSLLLLSSLRPLSPHLCTAGSFPNQLFFLPGWALATLPPSPPDTCTLSTQGHHLAQPHFLLVLWLRSYGRSGGGGPVRASLWLVALVPGDLSVSLDALLKEKPQTRRGLRGGCGGSAQWVSLGCGVMGVGRATACLSTCHTTIQNESLGFKGLEKQQATCRCHRRAQCIHRMGFSRVVHGTAIQGTSAGGLVKSVDSGPSIRSQGWLFCSG